ncbi:hypothetical protein [Aldersonia kunmingensis]|uniref:hypothetical protein n=1 Tax=Aldersonia kunmingensis TaxID=408066 RepID=UPI00082AC8A1|nr:hypothetical protein [Aldersonia kunmingensis]
MTTDGTSIEGDAPDARRPRISGLYATWRGTEYYARFVRDNLYIYTRETPLPAGFKTSVLSFFAGQLRVPGNEIDKLIRLESICKYRAESFEITNIVGDIAYLNYRGESLVRVALWPNMEQTDKYEVQGEAPLAELTDLEEVKTELPLPDQDSR